MNYINCNSNEFPVALKSLKPSLDGLYYAGDISLLSKPIFAIVGSRDCSEYGISVAKKFASELSDIGITVISGLAVGIDSYAHLASMKGDGKTIAVLPSGLTNVFPYENRGLFKDIIHNGGLVLSEYEPTFCANSNSFLKRNRIVSGLAMGTLVIEAEARSGTSVTAKYTVEQGNKLFCIPSNIDSKCGIGTNRMIQKGAKLVTCVNDILKEYEDFENTYVSNPAVSSPPPYYNEIYNFIGNGTKNVDDIFKYFKMNMSEIMYALTLLEMGNFIQQVPGNNYVQVRRI